MPRSVTLIIHKQKEIENSAVSVTTTWENSQICLPPAENIVLGK